MKRSHKLCSLIIPCILFTSTSCRNSFYIEHTISKEVTGGVLEPFDKKVEVVFYSKGATKYVYNLEDKITYFHKLFDYTKEYSDMNNLCTLNNNVGNNKYTIVDEDLYKLIKEGVNLTKLTKGYFNIALGKVIDIWEEKFNSCYMNDDNIFALNEYKDADINNYLQFTPHHTEIENYILFNDAEHSIKLNKYNSGAYKLNLDAFVKGYVFDVISKEFKENKYNGYIKLSDYSKEYYGNNKDNLWKDRYISPSFEEFANRRLFSLEFEGDMKISTVSDLEKHYIIEKNDNLLIRSNILNGKNGKPNNYYREVSVISRDCPHYLLDALCVSLFNQGTKTEVREMVSLFKETYNIDFDYMLCEPYTYQEINKFAIYVSENMKSLIREESLIDDIKIFEAI